MADLLALNRSDRHPLLRLAHPVQLGRSPPVGRASPDAQGLRPRCNPAGQRCSRYQKYVSLSLGVCLVSSLTKLTGSDGEQNSR